MLVIFIAMLFFTGEVYGQPGGGGGLGIGSFYSNKLDLIDISSDTSFKIRFFSMFEGKTHKEFFMFQSLPKESGEVLIFDHHYGYRIPSIDDADKNGYSKEGSCQRM
ncbi:hypothetical protein MYP_4108 [Sporocytophaga myxococcoides]|uniref:Uncharacterized protein n=1 Tax=Sporocytophaga myxococcoides TaxID=153721 RepID=A0A098LL86_9BACT|nr:hypothetical protein [Sporocytophaga myxococcoides]GAL86878.1 hypothetical protein MYP_4108 [Sporocytophaga myxococcoides]